MLESYNVYPMKQSNIGLNISSTALMLISEERKSLFLGLTYRYLSLTDYRRYKLKTVKAQRLFSPVKRWAMFTAIYDCGRKNHPWAKVIEAWLPKKYRKIFVQGL